MGVPPDSSSHCVKLNATEAPFPPFCSIWIFFPFNSGKKKVGEEARRCLNPRNIRKITFFFPRREFHKIIIVIIRPISVTNFFFITCGFYLYPPV